ncbi:FMN-binding negative transcriptional regulator [Amycolatopsis sp. VS8301801F10]|uniref:FMN-binding negative transcriptional regulator n=1 Tax=Amycolatopsis sp. VS8301801F10 TaxID=2652442 RepID=UPI0038FBFA5F
MYVPEQYLPPSEGWMAELIVRNPFAVLVTSGGIAEEPCVTHLPVVPGEIPSAAESAELAGGLLLGHLNRANPHWRALAGGTRSMLVFTGPDGYVSPAVYARDPAAPTWDYTAVHVHGTLRRIESPEESMNVVRSTARLFEERFGSGWDSSGSIRYFEELLPGVGAFQFRISRAEGMFKLSQEQPPEARRAVREHFSAHLNGGCRAVAELMKRLP